MSACPFKVGETYPTHHPETGQKGTGKVVHFEDAMSSMLVLHYNSKGEYKYVAWHDPKNGNRDPLSGHSDLIPPAPPMRRVPLTPADVPPGSVVRFSSWTDGWQAVEYVEKSGVGFRAPISGVGHWNWKECMDGGMMILRPGEDWQPMRKEVPEEGGEA